MIMSLEAATGRAGIDLVGRALLAPITQIVHNTGSDAPTIVHEVKNGKDAFGYDAAKQKFTLFNPWGLNNGEKPGLLTLSWSQIVANFSTWDYTM